MNIADPEQLSGPWVRYRAAADHLGISPERLRKLVMRDEIDCYRKIGKTVVFSLPGLDAWLNRIGSTERAKVA